MKRRIALCLLAVFCLFTGCADTDKYPEGMHIACKDIQLTIPGDFEDLSGESYAKDADFMFGHETLIVKGMAEYKAAFKEMTLDEYTAYVVSGNKLECSPERFGDGYRFTYEAPVGDTVYTYVTATLEGPDNFWIIQFYCPSEDLQKNLPEIDIILNAVRPA